ncbi:hypothetical protein LTR36_007793 [Oleoguttula mirabilis]|uniref:GYF domain-containing protein n=1 Tax=Oleoguttula mirabilis TaxID=1507867 RepID=A0AAV9JB74_9PEZI|nr:hypothetical protein LTR36_007793 [Oleoguttula mirabilis]
MPPSTFASAAASTNANSASARDGGPEWARRSNGATQTFRRPSGATSMAGLTPQPDGAISQPPPRYVPPHRNGTHNDMRYSKDQLLDAFRAQQTAEGALHDGLMGLYVGGWQPDNTNGAASAGWGRAEHSRDAQPAPDVCWDRDGAIEPLGLAELDEEERELFSTSVNTPLKPPSNANKDNPQSNGLPGRKISVSNNGATPGAYGLPSPSVPRGLGRRRETNESYPFPTNPAPSPSVHRDDQRAPSPPPALLRRRTDLKDAGKVDEEDDKSASTPFGTLKRNPTQPLSAGLGAPSSPWSNAPQSAGFSPMGSFGNFGLGSGQQTTPSDKRAGLGGGRAESRFKNLLSKDSSEDVAGSPSVQRKGSMSSLSRVNENESWRPQDPLRETEEDLARPSGSAALAGESADMNQAMQSHQQGVRAGGFGTPSRSGTQDEFGLGTFGMTSDNAHAFSNQGLFQGRDAFQQTPVSQRMAQQHMGGHEPMSPTGTNPYQSPEQHGINHLLSEDADTDGSDMNNAHLPGLGGYGGHDQAQQFGALGGLGALPNFGRAQGPASDRSQTSSVGANRGFPGLGGLGQLGGGPAAWPAAQPGFGTPVRQASGLSSAFGGGIFATSMGEMQSPSLAGLGGSGILSPSQNGGGFGGSRMASMFPSAMQAQMREQGQGGENYGPQAYGGLGNGMGREMQGQFAGQELSSEPQAFGAPGQALQPGELPQQLEDQQASQPHQPGSSASNQPPPSQQRTMVMPDRMRWIYRDPQGETQGPWSGLEMHDWYKVGFFTSDLLVKKYEDPDYEPLAQLIRRIGNSREPFLVPQIGIPHGAPNPATTGSVNSWAGAAAGGGGPGPIGGAGPVGNGGGPTSSGGAQPPFASSFPSFGTTLTADQQNALERRKQEEQYLMARQKEHLAQAQIAQRITSHQMGPVGGHHGNGLGIPGGVGGVQGLHHQGSTQSLHSQPSFGSITSPNTGAFQPSPSQGPAGGVPGFFDNSFRAPQSGGLGAVGAGVDSLGHIREEEIPGIMDRLNLGGNNRAGPGNQFGAPGQPFGQQQQQQQPSQEQQVQQMLQDRARLQQEQAQHDHAMQQLSGDDQPLPNERLQQFQQLQGQGSSAGLDARFQPTISKPVAPIGEAQASTAQSSIVSPIAVHQQLSQRQEQLSLTEQVEKAVSAQQSPAPQQIGLPQPFPPAPSQSPLPAPAAQRTGRQSVADQLQTESRDLSQTPSVETPSAAMAPWAKEPAEGPKGPSLKQIQEAEAKKAAQAEAIASAARRAAFEREMEAQAAVVVVQPGLPAGASWASAGGSPATPIGNAASPWTKAAQKATGAPAKTMAQIQKEEEARKRRLAAAAAQANAQAIALSGVAPPSLSSGGKSYANLAGKVLAAPAPPAGNAVNGAWTTVGASGKTKTPAPVPLPTPAPARVVSSGLVPGVQAAVRKAPSRSSTLNAGAVNAQEEFKKWAVGELRPDLNKGINADDFVVVLLAFPDDPMLLTEAVHGASNTIDSRHFAEEFLRRKKLAEKGQVDHSVPAKSASPHNAVGGQAGGWSEVAKKGPVKEAARDEGSGAFRVVATKKKGGKR